MKEYSRRGDIMEIVMLKLEEIHPYENNPRMNDDAVDAVAKSIKEYGFKVPIVVDTNRVIITGHTRYKASQKLELKEVPCIIANDLSDAKAKAFRLADNKVSDMSIWDNKKLLEELENIDKDLFTGFEESDFFESLLDETEFDALDENEAGVEYEVKFKSVDKEKIQKVIDEWNGMVL